MKLKGIKQKNYRLLKIYLILLGVCLKKSNKTHTDLTIFIPNKLETIELHFKTTLKIIQNYHQNKQKILFICNHNTKQNPLVKILEKTRHNYIETVNWTPGIFKSCSSFLRRKTDFKKENQSTIFYLRKKELASSLLNKPNLIVVVDSNIDSLILNEISQLNIPVIVFDNKPNLDKITTYKTVGNMSSFQNKQANFFIYSILKKQKISHSWFL